MAAKPAATVALRATNKFTLAFPGGLVNVPVALRPLAESVRPIPGKSMCPIHGATLNVPEHMDCCRGTAHEHELAKGEVLMGYPHPDDKSRYVPVDPMVVKSLQEPRSGSAAVEKMVDVTTIDPGYLSKSFVVWPQGGGEQAFDLLAAVLREEGKAAVVTVVLSKQTQTLVLRWSEKLQVVLAHVVEFESRLRHADVAVVAAAAVQRPEPAEQMLELARQMFATVEGEFDADDVVDQITPAMNDAIRAAADGVEYVVPSEPEAAPAAADDLMALMLASQQAATKKEKAPARKPAPRRTAKPNTARREKVAA